MAINNRLHELADQAREYSINLNKFGSDTLHAGLFSADDFQKRFAELIIDEHIDILRREWYRLNDEVPEPNESPRSTGIRLGRKTEIIVLIEKIKIHFGVDR